METKFLKAAIVIGALGIFWLIGGLAIVDAGPYFIGLGVLIATVAGVIAWGLISEDDGER